jgi:hypothetical protein
VIVVVHAGGAGSSVTSNAFAAPVLPLGSIDRYSMVWVP